MTARITKRQVVLDRLTHFTDSPLDRSVTQVGFAQTVDDDEPEYPELWIDLADFRALGEPERITITIEAGERLEPAEHVQGDSGPGVLDRVTDLFEKWASEENQYRVMGEYGLAEGMRVAIDDLRAAVHGAPACPICGSTEPGSSTSCDCDAHRTVPTEGAAS